VPIAALNHTHSGTGVAPGVHSTAGTAPVVLAQKAASSYNPFGTGPEHAEDVSSVIDGDLNTSWSTEHYIQGNLGKPGLGVALDASPGVVARAVEIQTPTPGLTAGVYAASKPPSTGKPAEGTSLTALGWTQLASPRTVGKRTTINLGAAGHPYRYYLIWIVHLPSEQTSAEISEVTLFR
jgi:eukaryotic-like serine/threonine-protein kinase